MFSANSVGWASDFAFLLCGIGFFDGCSTTDFGFDGRNRIGSFRFVSNGSSIETSFASS